MFVGATPFTIESLLRDLRNIHFKSSLCPGWAIISRQGKVNATVTRTDYNDSSLGSQFTQLHLGSGFPALDIYNSLSVIEQERDRNHCICYSNGNIAGVWLFTNRVLTASISRETGAGALSFAGRSIIRRLEI